MRDAFAVVTGARDAGINLVQAAAAAGRTLRGFEVDDAVSGYIASRGMAHGIRHRTGHSIGREVHGVGANMDNMETHDERPVIRGRVSRWSQRSTCQPSGSGRRSTCSSRSTERA
jgi:Xaa-Pro dipeptidase